MKFGDLFKRASTLEKEPPYKVGKMMEASPTRNKIRIVPAFKNQAGLGDANNGTTTHIDTLNVAEYAAAATIYLKQSNWRLKYWQYWTRGGAYYTGRNPCR